MYTVSVQSFEQFFVNETVKCNLFDAMDNEDLIRKLITLIEIKKYFKVLSVYYFVEIAMKIKIL